MMSTVLEEPQERLVSVPETGVMFMSRRSELRLVKVAKQPLRNAATGAKEGETPGESIAFRDGVYRIPFDGQAPLEDGRTVEGGELVGWLERHRLFGSTDEGFWRVDPTAPPVSPEELDVLQTAAVSLDVNRLRELVRQEQAGWNRSALVGAALKTIEQIETAESLMVDERKKIADEARAEGRAEAEREAAKAAKQPPAAGK